MHDTFSNMERAQVLTEALPYIKQYNGEIVVIKYGGNAMINEELKQQVMEDICLLWLIGLKSADIMIEGENAYGFLKSEAGVHRLVRVSPFDAAGRRHTSFSAVEVIPEIDDDVEVEIRPEDIEMQVYRSSGAGGQHINKTSSAVRLTHKPTGIVVSCQTQRDQFQNRESCMRMLRSKLVEIKEREHLEKISDIKGVQQKIEWGSQIRSYVFMPYTLAKDTRTGFEMTNINAVMDGNIDGFINAYLTCAATGSWVTK